MTPLSFHFYQIAISLLAASMIWQGGMRYFRHEKGQTLFKFSIRIVVWGGMSAVAIFPKLSNNLAHIIGIEGNINPVIMVGFVLIFLMIFKLLSAIERLEEQITTLTRKESLTQLKQEGTAKESHTNE